MRHDPIRIRSARHIREHEARFIADGVINRVFYGCRIALFILPDGEVRFLISGTDSCKALEQKAPCSLVGTYNVGISKTEILEDIECLKERVA